MKTTSDIRSFLLDQMQKAANGEADLAASKSVCNLAQQIYNTLNIELKMAVAKEKHGDHLELKPLDLDSK